jgi:hypothetical protein
MRRPEGVDERQPSNLRDGGASMLKAHWLLIVGLAAAGLSMPQNADATRDAFRLSFELSEAERRAREVPSAASHIGPACLPDPLPAVPLPPVYTFTAARSDETMRLEFFRRPCANGQPNAPLLVRVTPLSGHPFVCSSSFTVIQNAAQYDVRLATSSGAVSSFCNDVFVPLTLFVGHWSFDPPLMKDKRLPSFSTEDGPTIHSQFRPGIRESGSFRRRRLCRGR